jgi:hypothetical protein
LEERTMKTCRSVLIAWIVLAALCCVTAEGEAGQYIGDICWTVSRFGSSATGLLKLSFYYPGGLHLLATGKMTMGSQEAPYSGYLTVLKGQYLGQLSSSSYTSGTVLTQYGYFELKPTTLSGGYFLTSESANIQLPVSVAVGGSTGGLSLVACPPGS